jgi:hypothetical protein
MPLVTPGRRRRRVRALPWASDARAWPLLRAPGRPRMGPGRSRPDPAWLAPALLVVAAALAGFTLLRPVAPDGEGIALQAAARVAAGEVPYRDFWLNAGPGQPLLLAGLVKLFGPSLVWWRIVRVALVAVVALEAFALTRRSAPLVWALLAWVATAGALAWPADPGPTPAALALGLGALLLARRSPVGGGVLAGVAAAFRPELGLAAALGLLVAARDGPRAQGEEPADRAGVRAFAAAVAVAVLAWAPYVLAAPGAVWDQTAVFLSHQRDGAPSFPLRYGGGVEITPALQFYLPLLLLAGLALWALAALVRRPTREELALAPLALAGAASLLLRPDALHVGVLAAVAPAMLALAGAGMPVPLVRAALACSVGLVAVTGWELRFDQAVAAPDEATLRAPSADGVRAARGEAAALNSLVPFVAARVPPGRPVFVAAPRHDRARGGATLLYTLLERPNPTAYDPLRAGLVTTAAVQRRMVADLRAARPRVVVRSSSPAVAPSPGPPAGGAGALDRYLARSYRPVARFGDYTVLFVAAGARGTTRR